MNFLICNQRHFCNSKTSILDIKWHFWAHFKHQFFRLFSAFSNVADDTFMGLICLIFWMWLFKLLKRTKVESDTRIVELVTAYSRKFSESPDGGTKDVVFVKCIIIFRLFLFICKFHFWVPTMWVLELKAGHSTMKGCLFYYLRSWSCLQKFFVVNGYRVSCLEMCCSSTFLPSYITSM